MCNRGYNDLDRRTFYEADELYDIEGAGFYCGLVRCVSHPCIRRVRVQLGGGLAVDDAWRGAPCCRCRCQRPDLLVFGRNATRLGALPTRALPSDLSLPESETST